MKLRISCFKTVPLKKDIFRFTPVWALYVTAMMMVLLEMASFSEYDQFARSNLNGLVMGFGVVNLLYAGLCANLLFGDLYNTKLCYSLHAMPYRRESWLATHLAAGLLFSLVPNSIGCLYMMYQLESYWYLALCWLLAVTLQFVFFYGIATVSALLTGNRFAMLAVYTGFNFVALLLYATINVIYIPNLIGVEADFDGFSRFSPVVQLFQHKYFQFITVKQSSIYGNIYGVEHVYRFDSLGTGWGYMAILGCVGLAAMGLGFWLYRRRHLESAGDFIAFPRLKGIACVIMTLCVSLCFAIIGELLGNMPLWLAVGLFVGFFGSLMLLERRLKVFRKKTWLGFGAMALAVVLSLLAVHCDWFGIESWTPKADRVASVTVSNGKNNRYTNYLSATLEDEEDIAQIISAHEDIVDNLHREYNSYTTVYLSYKMKSGRTVNRRYRIPTTTESYEIIRRYLYDTDNLLGFTDAHATAQNVHYMYTNFGQIPEELYEKLLTALQEDCNKGAVLPAGDGGYYIEYSFTDSYGNTVSRGLTIKTNAPALSKLLKTPEIAMGYSDWDAFLAGMEALGLSGREVQVYNVSKEHREGLLSALRKDIQAGTVQVDNYASDAIELYYERRHPNGMYDYRTFCITKHAANTMTWLQENGYIDKD